MAKPNTINLGDLAKDTVSGYEGTVTVISEFLNGCRRICICPKVKDDGSFQDERWFDEPQMQITQVGAYQNPDLVEVKTLNRTGGVQKPTPRNTSI